MKITPHKFFSKSLIFSGFFAGVAMVAVGLFALPVFAYAPTLSIAPANNAINGGVNNSLLVSVSGQPNSAVQLYYYPLATNQYNPSQYNYNNGTYTNTSNSPQFAGTLGTTASNGYFSVTLSGSSYNIPSGASVYVLVGGAQSNVVVWEAAGVYAPGYPTGYPSGYPYSPAVPIAPVYPVVPVAPQVPTESGTVTVGVDQSVTIYAQSGGSYNVTSNSNSAVVSASGGGNSVVLTGNEVGSATVTICPVYYTYGASPCAAVYVTVIPTLSFSQSNVTLYGIGSSQSITLSGGYGSNNYNYNYNGSSCGAYYEGQYNCGQYYVANNTNPSIVSASISGSELYVSAIGYGGATLTVCEAAGSPCGTVYVSVNGSNNTYYSGYPGYSNYYPYQQQNVYVQPAPVYNYSQPVYSQPVYVMPGWMRRR